MVLKRALCRLVEQFYREAHYIVVDAFVFVRRKGDHLRIKRSSNSAGTFLLVF